MAKTQMFEGTWEELMARADEFRDYSKLILLVPESAAYPMIIRSKLTPEERIRGLDELVERNRKLNLPTLPDSAYSRESLYADDDELGTNS